MSISVFISKAKVVATPFPYFSSSTSPSPPFFQSTSSSPPITSSLLLPLLPLHPNPQFSSPSPIFSSPLRLLFTFPNHPHPFPLEKKYDKPLTITLSSFSISSYLIISYHTLPFILLLTNHSLLFSYVSSPLLSFPSTNSHTPLPIPNNLLNHSPLIPSCLILFLHPLLPNPCFSSGPILSLPYLSSLISSRGKSRTDGRMETLKKSYSIDRS